MKQSAKTLGVVALGAAFAAAAAGTASAVPSAAALGALSTVTAGTPLGTASKVLPAASPEALAGGQKKTSSDPVGSLLGGLPTDSLPTGPVASNLTSGGLTG
ncbi:hypothetical protein [Streptomyces sp. NPDC056670]|uniref:hypothetical protein n=1 Tax=unclassified Streptomyces TaxID=2593676 RepID=UPI00369F924B